MKFDQTYSVIEMNNFKECKWKDFYGDLRETIPPNFPEEIGKEVDLRGYVDSDHTVENKTRRSRSVLFIFLNTALIQWFSKKKATIETYMFGAEFVAMNIFVEILLRRRYKLRMTGVPISGTSYIYGDNMSVIHNTQRPESILKKKRNSI